MKSLAVRRMERDARIMELKAVGWSAWQAGARAAAAWARRVSPEAADAIMENLEAEIKEAATQASQAPQEPAGKR
jgi:hypothetical protein